MKPILLLTGLLCLSAMLVFAAGGTDNHASIQGCLSGSAGSYTLTDQSGKSYQLEGETSKLSGHVGQEVQLTGKEASSGSNTSMSASSATSTTASGSTSGASSESVKFNVSKVKKISDTCTSTKK
jgi:hypothetical protein